MGTILAKFLFLGRNFHSQSWKFRQIDGKSAKLLYLGQKFHSQNSLQTIWRQFDGKLSRKKNFCQKSYLVNLMGMNISSFKIPFCWWLVWISLKTSVCFFSTIGNFQVNILIFSYLEFKKFSITLIFLSLEALVPVTIYGWIIFSFLISTQDMNSSKGS